jgi:replicative DNA helicase
MAILGDYPSWMLDGKPKGKQGKLFTLDPEFYAKVADSAEWLHGLPIEFASTSVSFFMDDVRKAITRMMRKHGKPCLVVLDYVQLMDSKARETRAEQLSIISKQVKHIANRTKCAFLVLAQVNQKVDKQEDKVPETGDISDSSGITKAADAVWFIHRPEYFEARKERRREHEISEAKIVVRKGRGTEGSGEVSLWFQKKNTRFFEAQP